MTKVPEKQSRCSLVLEVLFDRASPPKWVQLVTSIPGREGTTSRTWGLSPAGLDAATAADLTVWLSQTVQDMATLSTGGVQGVIL